MTSAPAHERQSLELRTQDDCARAVLLAQHMARTAGFDAVGINRFATAVSELVQNVLRYAQHGQVHLRQRVRSGRCGVEAVVEDQGPGIADVAHAMREHTSSGGGLGLGLPGTRRMMDDFELVSEPGAGTRVTIRLWSRA